MKKTTVLWNLLTVPLAVTLAFSAGCPPTDDDDSSSSSSNGGPNRSSSGPSTSSGGSSGTISSSSSGGSSGVSSSSSSGGSSGTSSSSGGSSGVSSSSSSGGSSGTSSSSSSSGGVETTIPALKALIAADPNCWGSTGTNCQYNIRNADGGYYDIVLNEVYVVSVEHSDFDNPWTYQDGGRAYQKAIYVAENLTAAANEGIEVIAPPFYTIPTVQVGDLVVVQGSLRSRFGNTYIFLTNLTVVTPQAQAATPVSVTVEQMGNNIKGAVGPSGGCGTSGNEDLSLDGEPYEGALVDVTFPNPLPITWVQVGNDGGFVNIHRFSIDGKLMVADNFGFLPNLQGDAGTGIAIGKTVSKLRGFGYYSYGCRKIQPRSADDITIDP